jgi:hypothetical protein
MTRSSDRPKTGIVYMTEDDTRKGQTVGVNLRVAWITVPEPGPAPELGGGPAAAGARG